MSDTSALPKKEGETPITNTPSKVEQPMAPAPVKEAVKKEESAGAPLPKKTA